ncbi:MAG: hypothetical protein A2900_00710 [Candidatus Chisholmbacteria bacterium RIFCSPLOWO2_01_FULL_50_28]|uniref:2'-5' RNA ligase n=1 Tax=Candidatus Chisholmbacteria bacterium RIFCSPHIGHO2_01_FULL_52_32 TaxID=1797591 RepID=A0A1G1VRX0_9BACT|nr:MAG: hypothetical protein A2786_00200 [Candidatus Chisholmbacteria bacterium RIFCSPHIGHO2_01_FULL_52_32]OGY19616.1 MAG: hypothetical protein A2900_00710 [Candidatus Chisholmbacteria bacterium RIFCSPLOWO2_01_FULL_50_28]
MQGKGYSLWLKPSGEIYEQFSKLIEQLAQEHSAPIFHPHVTLLSEILRDEEEIMRKTQELTMRHQPFPVTLGAVDYQDYSFRALFVRADKTRPLLDLHNDSKELFDMQGIPPYMPHLSLLYGNFARGIKDKIVQEIGSVFTTQFEVSSVHLFKTYGAVDIWYRVKEFPLGKTY